MRVAIKVCATLVVSVGALISAGCVEDPDEPALEEEGEEVVGKTQQAIGGEAACAALSITSSVFGETQGATLGDIAHSPDDKYNPGSTCPNQYIAEFTGWNLLSSGKGFDPRWDTPMPNNSTDCANARMTMHVYGYSGGSWNTTPVYYRKANGSWSGSVCSWSVVDSGGTPGNAAIENTNTKVRAVLLGYLRSTSATTGLVKNDFKPVRAEIVQIPE